MQWEREGRGTGRGREKGEGKEGDRGWKSKCTDGNTVFSCDSDKNSLVIIFLYLKVLS